METNLYNDKFQLEYSLIRPFLCFANRPSAKIAPWCESVTPWDPAMS